MANFLKFPDWVFLASFEVPTGEAIWRAPDGRVMDAYRGSERVKMASHLPRPLKVSFGPYELDPSSGELRKGGVSVKLNPQPFRVLCMLVERAGQSVTREEIRDALWGADTYVEFERGINFCVSQIRAALCDEVQAPRYVETLPKRGYRFIAQVSGVMGRGSVSAAAGGAVAGTAVMGAASIAEVSAGGPGMAAVYELRAPATSEAGEEELRDPSVLDSSVRETRASRVGSSNLWMMREGGGGARGAHGDRHGKPVQLTNGPLNFHAPRPSRDGKAVFAIGRQELSELVRVNPQTGGVEPYLGGISAMQVRISPDKQRAAWVSYPDGTLWSGKLDGSEKRQLTEAPLRAEYPRWSPDGEKISFTGVGAGKALGVYVLSAEGGSARRIGPENAVTLSWAPDGKRAVVAVFGAREGVAGDAAAASVSGEWIELMDLATGRTTAVQGSENLIGPDWSPDGKYVMAKSNDDNRVMLYDVAAGKWRELAHGGVMTNLRWSRDGSYAYFEEASAEEAELMRIRVESRDGDGKNDWVSERVMDFRNIRRPLVTLSTAWSGLAEDDAPIFERDIGTQEIYRLEWEEK